MRTFGAVGPLRFSDVRLYDLGMQHSSDHDFNTDLFFQIEPHLMSYFNPDTCNIIIQLKVTNYFLLALFTNTNMFIMGCAHYCHLFIIIYYFTQRTI